MPSSVPSVSPSVGPSESPNADPSRMPSLVPSTRRSSDLSCSCEGLQMEPHLDLMKELSWVLQMAPLMVLMNLCLAMMKASYSAILMVKCFPLHSELQIESRPTSESNEYTPINCDDPPILVVSSKSLWQLSSSENLDEDTDWDSFDCSR